MRPRNHTTPRHLLLLVVAIAAATASACGPTSQDEGLAYREVTLDPTRAYADRVTLMGILKDAHPYPAGIPDHRDGILLQTRWQMNSGRDTRDASGLIGGWWSSVNYTLTVWQAQALIQGGDFNWLTIIRYADSRFDLPQHVAQSVRTYYAEIDRVRGLDETGALSAAERDAAAWRLQELLWVFHTAAVEAGLERSEDLLERLPKGERRFATSWGYSVIDILAAMNFPTDQGTVGRIQDITLPPRIVTEADFDLTRSSDLSAACRGGLVAMEALHKFESWTGGSVRWIVERVVDSAEDAAWAADVLEDALRHAGTDIVDWMWDTLTGGRPDEPTNTPPPPSDTCGGVTYLGYCDAGVSVWCDGGQLYSYDCTAGGQGCGWVNEEIGTTCVDGCGELDYYGGCDGDSLRWCQDGAVQVIDCAASQTTCSWQNDSVGFNCL